MKVEQILIVVLMVIGILFIINEINKNSMSIIMDKIDKLSNKISDKNVNTVDESIIVHKEPIGYNPS